MTGRPVESSWYTVWGAAVSILAMCVRYDKEGVSISRGMFQSSLAHNVIDTADSVVVAGDSEIAVRVMYGNPGDLIEAVA